MVPLLSAAEAAVLSSSPARRKTPNSPLARRLPGGSQTCTLAAESRTFGGDWHFFFFSLSLRRRRKTRDALCLFVCLLCVLSLFSISCLARSRFDPAHTFLFCLLKHGPHCRSHRGKASADLLCLYCRRATERERESESVGREEERLRR